MDQLRITTTLKDTRHFIILSFESLDIVNYNGLKKSALVIQEELNTDEKLSNTFEVFSFYHGNLYKYYKLRENELIPRTTLMDYKLIQLSIISLISNLKSKAIAYDVLIDEFELNDDLALEKLLIPLSNSKVLTLKLDSPTRVVHVVEFESRNVVKDVSQLFFLQKDQVVCKDDLIQSLTQFRDNNLTNAISKLDYNDDFENGDVINKLIKSNLNEINEIVGYNNNVINPKQDIEEVKSRKRKVGE